MIYAQSERWRLAAITLDKLTPVIIRGFAFIKTASTFPPIVLYGQRSTHVAPDKI